MNASKPSLGAWFSGIIHLSQSNIAVDVGLSRTSPRCDSGCVHNFNLCQIFRGDDYLLTLRYSIYEKP